jgi:hypothetical protein
MKRMTGRNFPSKFFEQARPHPVRSDEPGLRKGLWPVGVVQHGLNLRRAHRVTALSPRWGHFP